MKLNKSNVLIRVLLLFSLLISYHYIQNDSLHEKTAKINTTPESANQTERLGAQVTKTPNELGQDTNDNNQSIQNNRRIGNESKLKFRKNNSINVPFDQDLIRHIEVNNFLRKKNLQHLPNIIAKIKPDDQLSLVHKTNNFYFYKNEKNQLPNVFLNEKNNKIYVWSGELIVESPAMDLPEYLSKLKYFKLVKKIGNVHILKIIREGNFFDDVDQLEKNNQIINIELDLKHQRLRKI